MQISQLSLVSFSLPTTLLPNVKIISSLLMSPHHPSTWQPFVAIWQDMTCVLGP